MTGDGGWRIGVDTGGTFTDLVAVSPAGEVRLRKVSSTPSQPSAAVFAALERTEPRPGAVGGLLRRWARRSPRTRSSSALVPGRIFITTAGFEDILYIQRIDRKGLYDLQWVKAATVRAAPRHPRRVASASSLTAACARP